MKMRITVIFMVALLTGCTASSSPQLSSDGVETVVGKVPTSCEISEVINVFSAQVPGSRYIPTQWQPSPDTDLEAAIRNQGIACTYGIQEAEVGGTILWASNSKNIWDERKPFWSSEGETPIDLPGIEETSAYILNDGTSADEMHVWRINVFSAQVPGSRYIPTQWQPSPDTDLAAAIRNQGIACTYGIQEAEAGGTILWASNSKNIWDERKKFWSSEGETPLDLPGIEETSAYILNDGTSADEMHVWRINILIRGVWIQIGASFLQNLNEALPIIKASIAALDK